MTTLENVFQLWHSVINCWRQKQTLPLHHESAATLPCKAEWVHTDDGHPGPASVLDNSRAAAAAAASSCHCHWVNRVYKAEDKSINQSITHQLFWWSSLRDLVQNTTQLHSVSGLLMHTHQGPPPRQFLTTQNR